MLVLETSLSIPQQARQPDEAVAAPNPAKSGGSVEHSTRFASEPAKRSRQGSNILLAWKPAATPLGSLLYSKLIKEDHFLACTTRMSEIGCASPGGETTWILRTPPYTGGSEATSSRLADYSLVKDQNIFQPVHRHNPENGGGILASLPPLSTPPSA